jgi:hypothetical protein
MMNLKFEIYYKYKKIKINYFIISFFILLYNFYLEYNSYFTKFLKNIQSYNIILIFILYKFKVDNYFEDNL